MLQKTAKGNLHWSIDVRKKEMLQGAAVLGRESALEHWSIGVQGIALHQGAAVLEMKFAKPIRT